MTAYHHLQKDVIHPGLCSACGTCIALSNNRLTLVEKPDGPVPVAIDGDPDLPELAYDACPGKGLDYPTLNRHTFGDVPENWLTGVIKQFYIGYAADEGIRRNGASGGVITQTVLYLLEEGKIDGAVMVRQGGPRPTDAEAIIATTREEVLSCAQSVYRPVPVNTALRALEGFEGKVAYVGLPEHVASLRALQKAGYGPALACDYVLGPYTGTNMVFEAVRSYLRSNGVTDIAEVTELKWRAGEWPGYMQITLRDGRVLKASKFYYNYLIPFYVTRTTLFSVDFTNELTDISVGDAWSPKYEAQGEGFSVVLARTEKAQTLLEDMAAANIIALDPVGETEALAMHGHMLDFKKRGSFIRAGWRKLAGMPAPDYGYRPARIEPSRYAVEIVISAIFRLAATRPARWLVEQIPLEIIGPAFNWARKTWKDASKPVKRKGLGNTRFLVTSDGEDIPFTPIDDDAPVAEKINAELDHWRRRRWSLVDVGRHWDATEDYDDINEETYSYFRRFVDGLRYSDLAPNGRVLDITARTGNGTLYFWENGKVGEAVLADPSEAMGEVARQRLTEGGMTDFTWVKLTDYPLPLPSATFDSVLCFETVEHLAEPEKLVMELGRVTKPGGQMILTTPNVLWEPVHALAAVTGLHHSEGPHRFVGRSRLHNMIEAAGFEVVAYKTTVLVPSGPGPLVKFGEWLEENTRTTLTEWLGLRRVFICRKV